MRGLKAPAAQEVRARRLHRAGDGERLLARLHRAGPGHDHEAAAAHRHVAHAHDAVLGLHLARDELVGVGDGDDLEHAGQALEDGRVQRALVAGDADGGALGARDGVGLEAAGLDRLRPRRGSAPRVASCRITTSTGVPSSSRETSRILAESAA